jgi:PTH1 family peptidyl-tRNA hydrolase
MTIHNTITSMNPEISQDLCLCHTSVMSYIIAGLGNPGQEYENTRHNIGRIVLTSVFDVNFSFNKKINALDAEVKIGKEKVRLISPETFMNNSGKAIAHIVKSIKAAEKLIVIYDDFNLPLGKIRISFNRSSGGHNGLQSIIKAVKTEAFIRIRIGVAPENAKGVAKVPHGDDKIEKFILGKLKDEEVKIIKKVSKRVSEAIEVLIKEGKDKAMSIYNAD